jgi:hypothetical protein
MAKNYEFRPDKPLVSWVSKLHLTKLQRGALLKWSMYALLLLALSILQDVVLCRFRLFNATSELLPCAIVLITVMEGSHAGSLFALISSCLYVFSGSAPGAYSLILITFLAIFVCIFRQGFLQKGFAAAMLCTVFAVVVYEAATFVIGLVLGLTFPERWFGFAVTAGFSTLAAPILYPIVLSISAIGGESWKE